MNQSDNINELAKSLALAQGEMQAAIKDSVNPFFKSKYADLGSVWDAARPVLSKNGLCVMQTTEMIGDKVVMVTTLAHISGQWVKSYLPLNPSKNDSQGMGAAITYLRRYSLSALVGVVCDDDDDGETAVGRGKVQIKQSLPNLKQENKHDLCKNDKKTEQTQPDTKMTQDPKLTEKLTSEQLDQLMIAYAPTTQDFKENMEKYIAKEWKVKELEHLPAVHFQKIMNWIAKNMEMQAMAVNNG